MKQIHGAERVSGAGAAWGAGGSSRGAGSGGLRLPGLPGVPGGPRLARGGLWLVFGVGLVLMGLLQVPMADACNCVGGGCDLPYSDNTDPETQAEADTPDDCSECSPSDDECRMTSASPIDYRNGFVRESVVDLSLPGPAPGLGYSQTRDYSSGLHEPDQATPLRHVLGERWRAGAVDRVVYQPAGTTDLVVGTDAASKRSFTLDPQALPNGDLSYFPPDGMTVTLVRSDVDMATEKITLTDLDTGRVLVFGGLSTQVDAEERGRLIQRTTRERQAAGDPAQPGLPGLDLMYNDQGYISTVVTPQGWHVAYEYEFSGAGVLGKICRIRVWDGPPNPADPSDPSPTLLQEVVYTYHNDVNPDRLEEVVNNPEYSADPGRRGHRLNQRPGAGAYTSACLGHRRVGDAVHAVPLLQQQ